MYLWNSTLHGRCFCRKLVFIHQLFRCGHCKSLAPAYEIVATTFKKAADVIIAKVDATEEPKLQERFGIKGFPTLKFFPKGETKPEDYEEGRSEDAIIGFVNKKAGTTYRVSKPPTAVTVLTSSDFDAIVLDPSKHVLVEFYAPWCGHCKSLAPVYEQVAKAFKAESNVVIANVNADEFKDLAKRFGVSGFPTLKYFGTGTSEPEAYSSGRTGQDLVNFMNEKAATHRTVEGGLTNQAGRVEAIDVVLTDSGDVTNDVVEKAEKILEGLKGDALKHGNLYLKAMKKVLQKGNEYVESEIQRLEKLIQSDSVSDDKKTLFLLRKNILQAFKKQ